MKKTVSVLLAAVLLLALAACGSAPAKDSYTVGVCQLVQFVVSLTDVKAPGKVSAFTDFFCGLSDLFYRQERTACYSVASQNCQQCQKGQQPEGKPYRIV